MNAAQRKQAVLDALEKHEEMLTLLDCLSRSPAVYGDPDLDSEAQTRALEKGYLELDAGYCQTTKAGRSALIAYINGTDDEDE